MFLVMEYECIVIYMESIWGVEDISFCWGFIGGEGWGGRR